MSETIKITNLLKKTIQNKMALLWIWVLTFIFPVLYFLFFTKPPVDDLVFLDVIDWSDKVGRSIDVVWWVNFTKDYTDWFWWDYKPYYRINMFTNSNSKYWPASVMLDTDISEDKKSMLVLEWDIAYPEIRLKWKIIWYKDGKYKIKVSSIKQTWKMVWAE